MDVGEVALVQLLAHRVLQVHPGGAAQHPARDALAGAQQQEGRDVVRGILLAAENGDLEQVEERVARLVEQHECDAAHERDFCWNPVRRRAAGSLLEIGDVLVAKGDRLVGRLVPGVGLAVAAGELDSQRLGEPERAQRLGELLQGARFPQPVT